MVLQLQHGLITVLTMHTPCSALARKCRCLQLCEFHEDFRVARSGLDLFSSSLRYVVAVLSVHFARLHSKYSYASRFHVHHHSSTPLMSRFSSTCVPFKISLTTQTANGIHMVSVNNRCRYRSGSWPCDTVSSFMGHRCRRLWSTRTPGVCGRSSLHVPTYGALRQP